MFICNLCGVKEAVVLSKGCASKISPTGYHQWISYDEPYNQIINSSCNKEVGPKMFCPLPVGHEEPCTRPDGNWKQFLPQQATRTPLSVRYDLLEASFLRAMAKIGQHGANKFGEANYKLSRMSGKDSPGNHIMNHLERYRLGESYDNVDVGTERKYHLAAIAFNAMMEYWYEEHFSGSDKDSTSNT